jgi:hypothetical protein
MHERLTIISTALPKLALINPPKVCPTFADNSSVEYDSRVARGNIAKKLRIKTVDESQPKAAEMMPSGTKTRRKFVELQHNVAFVT